MTDYKKLVEALRCCIPNPPEACEGCTYNMGGVCNTTGMMTDAADAIEALQAAEPTENQVVDYCHKRCLVVLGADLFHELKASYGKLPKRGKWILCGPVGWPNWKCTVCQGDGRGDFMYCPWCGAKMEVQDDD